MDSAHPLFTLYINIEPENFPGDPTTDIAHVLDVAAEQIRRDHTVEIGKEGYRTIGYFQNITVNGEIVGSYALKQPDGSPWGLVP